MPRITTYFTLFLLFWCAACRGTLDEQEFFIVSFDQPVIGNSLKRLPLKANIGALSKQTVDLCGFYWSNSDTALIDPVKSGAQRILASPPVNSGAFTADFDGLKPFRVFYFKAFAQVTTQSGSRMVLSDNIRAFSLDQIVTLSDRPAEVYNDTAVVYGRTVGLDTLRTFVSKHGFVFSDSIRTPAIGLAGCRTTNLGVKRGDGIFSDRLFPLKFNTTYYYRAYVADNAGDIHYSQRIDSVRVRDGWIRTADFPTVFRDASVAVWQDKGFVGFGCPNSIAADCFEHELTLDFRMYQPSSARWSHVRSLDTIDGFRINASMFTIGDTIYMVGGEYTREGPGEEKELVAEFWKYAPLSNSWRSGDIPIGFERTNACAFVIGNKGYVGCGIVYNAQKKPEKYANDFWEYTPANGRWRRVAPLPLKIKIKGEDVIYSDIGRFNAIAFTLGSRGYVGGGQENLAHLPDFWEFTPPTSATDLGKWTYVGTIPSPLRTDAVGFAIGNKGYYGTGFSYDLGYLRDFHEFEPGKGWRPRAALPIDRAQAFGFGLGNRGYLGTGFRNIRRDNITFTRQPLSDMWQYIPER